MESTVIVGEAVAGQSAALRKRMLLLSTDLTKNTFDLAEAFFEAQNTHCYLQWGFESLGDYSVRELGIKHRRAQYLARIVRVCREVGVVRRDYEPVGITKLREITTLKPGTSYYNMETREHEPMADHIVELIAEGPELTTVEVEEEVNRLKGMTGDNAMVLRSYKVTLSAWENVLSVCFEAVRKRMGSAGRDGTGAAKEYTDGNCIEMVCAEYIADPSNFFEEPNESRAQIETEDDNGIEGNSTDTLRSNVRDGEQSTSNGQGRSLDELACEEVPQDTFPSPRQVVPSE